MLNKPPDRNSKYEYIRLEFDFGDLSELNSLSLTGWRVVAVRPVYNSDFDHYALLEREVLEEVGDAKP